MWPAPSFSHSQKFMEDAVWNSFEKGSRNTVASSRAENQLWISCLPNGSLLQKVNREFYIAMNKSIMDFFFENIQIFYSTVHVNLQVIVKVWYINQVFLCSKNKFYDGSSTLKMTGNDCKLLEDNCKKLIEHFLKVQQYKSMNFRGLNNNLFYVSELANLRKSHSQDT